jgi:hypothetical protein
MKTKYPYRKDLKGFNFEDFEKMMDENNFDTIKNCRAKLLLVSLILIKGLNELPNQQRLESFIICKQTLEAYTEE